MYKVSIKYVYLQQNHWQHHLKELKNQECMEYLFLRRKRTTSTSLRQRELLFKAAERHWKEEISSKGTNEREIDRKIYKSVLYQLEIKKVFLDSGLSLKKLSAMIETNQTYLSNVVNRYFECNLNELVNRYRIEYAKELLHAGNRKLKEISGKCGFASKSPFYVAFKKIAGMTPRQYMAKSRQSD